MNVGFGPVTSPGVEALTRDWLHHVDQSYLRSDTLAAANTALVEAQARIPLAQAWGGGLVASVDGLRPIAFTPFSVPFPIGRARAGQQNMHAEPVPES